MRKFIFSLLAAACLPCAVAAQQSHYAIPLQKDVAAYRNEVRKLYETPVFHADKESRLLVREKGENVVLVQNADGITGWIERSLVKIVRENAVFSYDPASVESRLDDPFQQWVIVGPDYVANPISLDRSFAEALRENVDREIFVRQTR
jgi:hypothetical protein